MGTVYGAAEVSLDAIPNAVLWLVAIGGLDCRGARVRS